MGIVGILHEITTTFSDATRQAILIRDNYTCRGCGSSQIHSIHHLVENTVVNRRNYGNERIQSAENGCPTCFDCHVNHRQWDKDLRDALIIKWAVNKSKIKPCKQP